MRFSTDGGANYDAGASDYRWTVQPRYGSGCNPQSDAADSEITIVGQYRWLTTAVSNVAAEGGTVCLSSICFVRLRQRVGQRDVRQRL